MHYCERDNQKWWIILLHLALYCRDVGPKVAACPAYLQSNSSSKSRGEDDADYHYVPSQNVQVNLCVSGNHL